MIDDETARSIPDQPAATVGGHGPEPCRDCRAPLVPGQRYCLYCGARCPEARLEFLDVLVQDVAGVGPAPVAAAGAVAPSAVVSAPVAPGSAGVNGWLRQHSPVLGLTGLLLATLLIGLLIGHWATSGSSEPVQAAAPSVIRIQGGAAAPAAETSATGDAAADGGGSGAGDAGSSGDGGGGAKAKSESAGGGAAAAAKADAKKAKATAPKDAVSTKELSSLSGAAKEKAIEKAAKKGQPIATGDGTLPPTDDEAPASGAEFETIG